MQAAIAIHKISPDFSTLYPFSHYISIILCPFQWHYRNAYWFVAPVREGWQQCFEMDDIILLFKCQLPSGLLDKIACTKCHLHG